MRQNVTRTLVLALCALILAGCGCSGACVKASGGIAVGVGGFFYCLFNECHPASTY